MYWGTFEKSQNKSHIGKSEKIKSNNQLKSEKLLAKQNFTNIPHIKIIYLKQFINNYFWNNIIRSLKSNFI